MKEIIFATGNKRKVQEAKLACEPLGIVVIDREFEIEEIQSLDPRKVTRRKVKDAYEYTKAPVVVTDTFWNITALNGFPGAYAKDVDAWFTEKNFVDLVADYDDKSISFTENIAYYDGIELVQFEREFWGIIVEPRGKGQALENVVEISGKTLGEHRELGTVSHSAEEYAWIDFAKWYIEK